MAVGVFIVQDLLWICMWEENTAVFILLDRQKKSIEKEVSLQENKCYFKGTFKIISDHREVPLIKKVFTILMFNTRKKKRIPFPNNNQNILIDRNEYKDLLQNKLLYSLFSKSHHMLDRFKVKNLLSAVAAEHTQFLHL